jgi:glycosyltransferase involved in cell wall biosynthesis
MSFGLPLVVSDRGGPGSAVDAHSGFRVAPHSPDHFAVDLAGAITTLVDDPALRASMGAAGRRRVAGLAVWDLKVELLEDLYTELLSAHSIGR